MILVKYTYFQKYDDDDVVVNVDVLVGVVVGVVVGEYLQQSHGTGKTSIEPYAVSIAHYEIEHFDKEYFRI